MDGNLDPILQMTKGHCAIILQQKQNQPDTSIVDILDDYCDLHEDFDIEEFISLLSINPGLKEFLRRDLIRFNHIKEETDLWSSLF